MKPRYGVGSKDPVLNSELQTANKLVAPAARLAMDYANWFAGEVQSSDPNELMSLVMQHTRNWGITQAILSELDSLDIMLRSVEQDAMRGIGRKHRQQHAKMAQAKSQVIRSVYMAKLLKEIFIKDTNFTEVVYDQEY